MENSSVDAQLLERYRAVLPSFVKPMFEQPISIDRGEGSYVFSAGGDRYLDFFGGVLTTMIGHNHPKVRAAVAEQASKVMHTSTLYLIEPMIELAERIAATFRNPRRPGFLHLVGHRGQRHGAASGHQLPQKSTRSWRCATATTAARSRRRRSLRTARGPPPRSRVSTVNFVQGGYRLRSPFRDLDDDAFTAACVDDLAQVLDMMSAGDVACLIAEPIQGVGGFATPPDGFFGAFRKVLDARGILLISDEVQTGWGRTGEHFWGYQAHDTVPDMLTFAKGVGNGAALAGVVARAEIMDTIKVTSFSTFGGNPLSAAAGNATLQALEDEGMQANALARGRQLTTGLEAAVAANEWMAELRGKGLMQALEFVHAGSNEADAGTRRRIPRALPSPRTARRQGRPVWQRDPDRPDAQRHRG